MILVTIELLPGGAEFLRRTLAEIRIANVSNLSSVSNYAVVADEGENRFAGTLPRRLHGRVTSHERATSVLVLVAKALKALETE